MRRFLTILIIIILLGAGGFFGLRYFRSTRAQNSSAYQTEMVRRGTLTAIVGATGTVHANQSAMLSWQTSGRIDKILVNLGDKVQPGEVLSSLAKQSLSQSIILAEADRVTAQRNLDQLLNSETQKALAYQKLVNAQKELEEAKKARQSKDYQRATNETIDEAQANYLLAENKYQDAREEYNQYADRAEDDPVRAFYLSKMVAAQKERDRAFANLNYLRGGPDSIDISLADARLLVAEAALQDAQREYDRLKDGADPADIQAAQARLDAIEATLNLAYLKAPFAGTITQVMSKVGDQVNPGTVSFRIDDLSRMLVDVDVTEIDINRIQVGQTAFLTFDAILDKTYEGVVVEVGQVGQNIQGVINFKVTIELSDPDESVKPGMTAAVNIVVNELQNVLLIPNRAVRIKDGKQVIYLLKDGQQQPPTEIVIGATSEQNSQLLAGDVKEGDLVILNPNIELNFTNGRPGMFR